MNGFMYRKRWALLGALMLVTGLVFAGPVLAAEIVDDEGTLVIEVDEVIEDDYVFFGQGLIVEGTIEGDLVAFAQTITVADTGVVEGDLIAAGQSVIVEGEVGEDSYVAGFLIQLGEAASLADELFAGTYSLEASAGSRVGGDVRFGGFQALLAGTVDGNVQGGGNSIQIDGGVGGDVEVGVGDPGEDVDVSFTQFNPQLPDVATVPSGLTIGDDASIGGNLSYTSSAEGNIPSGVVGGRTDFNQTIEEQPEFEFRPSRPGSALAFLAGRTVLRIVRRFISLTLVGLLVVWLASKLLTETVQTFKARPWNSLGVGVLGYAVALFAIVIVPGLLVVLAILLGIISLGGLTPAIIGLGSLGWGALFVGFLTAVTWLAKIILGFWLGDLIWHLVQPEGTSLVPPMIIGAALAAILTSIPLLGGLLGFVVALFGLGALVLAVRARNQPAEVIAPASA